MSSAICRVCGAMGMFLVLAAGALPCGSGAHAADLAVYGDGLAASWENWSWSTTTGFANASPVYSGTQSLAVTYTGAWAGLYLATNTPVSTGSHDTLQFWIHGGAQGGQAVQVVLADGTHTLLTDQAVAVSVSAGAWTQVKVPLADLGNPAQIGGIVWQDTSGGAQPTYYLDDVSFITQGIVPPPPPPPGTGPALRINVATGRRAISEGIYGMNFADEPLAAELRLPVRRWGGNSTTRYNWQTSMINVGSDWYFENLQEGTINVAALPNGSASDQFVEQDRRTETKTLITIPLIGWTPKSTSPRNHPYDCAFKVSKYGPQQSTDSWDPNCGNGLHADNTPIVGNDPADTSMQIGPNFVTAWINHLTGKYGNAAHGGVAYYNLDNEPMLWSSTHRDVHPLPTSYDELRDRTYQYAAAVKTADPSAKTLGPVLWGWCAYFYSALDGCSNGPDYQAHGNTPFVAWYLQQMKAYEQQQGTRILDYLDLHYYPQANGVALSSAGGAATQALRLRSTRSLWDPSYLDESWISDTAPGGVSVRLIPRMQEWVTANYPGTKLAITEYNWGALDHINGALAQADVLGIFGREGLDLATLWGPPTATQPGAFAFRMYRNYDGTGQGFGDVNVAALSDDQSAVAVYAAQRSIGSALTVIIINKTATSLTSRVNLTGFVPTSTAAVYRYSTANLSAIEHLPDQPLTGSEFDVTLPASSITLFVLTPGSASPAHAAGVGVFRGGAWYVDRDHDQTWEGCSTDGCYTFGMTGDTPVVGDWDGTGTGKIGVYRKSTGVWYLDFNGNGTWDGCDTDKCIPVGGDSSDNPLVGDWNGSGATRIGVYRASTGTFYLDDNGNGTWDGCGTDRCLQIGLHGDIPLVGDWNGSGTSKVGAFRPSDGTFYLDYNGNGVWDGCGTDGCLQIGMNGDIPLVGDWNGSGTSKVGAFRPNDGTFYLDFNGSGIWEGCATDRCLQIGVLNDVPLVGDWDGSGTAKVGAFRPADGTFYLDYNGNGTWDGCGLDRCLSIGMNGDEPLAGKW